MDTPVKCAAWVKNKGHHVYGSHRCTRTPVPGDSYCKLHLEVLRRAAAKLRAIRKNA